MIRKPVTQEQFSVQHEYITHEPTGAKFLRRPHGIYNLHWGLAGLAPGAEYDPAEIKAVAEQVRSSPRAA
jgi:hypothetical protein